MIQTDKDGNKLIVTDREILLKLKNKREKQVFKLSPGGHVEKYVTQKNIMRVIGEEGGVGFNYAALKILRDKLKAKKIAVRIGNRTPLHVEIDDIFKNGKFLHFINDGYELQIFLPIEMMK